MSDPLQHECGIAFVRLKKDLAYYHDRYGTCLWGFQRLYLLMEKQHNRGQDGVGVGCCKINMPLGQPYLFRERSAERDSLIRVMEDQLRSMRKLERKGILDPHNPESFKTNFDFGGEVLLGHLRYGTSGTFGSGGCHPYVRRTNYPTKTLMVAGNFNMTNARDLNHHLIDRGQHPVFDTDTQTVLEEIGYHLDEVHDAIYRRERDKGTDGSNIPGIISEEIDLVRIIGKCSKIWDGGYTIAGVVGNGDGFVLRDPNGIRPCFYYEDEEVIAFASERVPLMTVFNAEIDEVRELPRAHVAVMKHTGGFEIAPYTEPREARPCSFERIYFSRGNDPDIYRERMRLGSNLVPQIVSRIDADFDKTVFSFIPNTAEIAYYGLMHGLRMLRRDQVKDEILAAAKAGELDEATLDKLVLKSWPRGEKIAHKDIKLRTFIAQEKGRDQMVSHVYDVTYGQIGEGENLVVIDDSVVRGTTLKDSIIKILSRLNPKKIVIASTAPQIRYPGLLRHRHVRARQIHRLQGGDQPARTSRDAQSHYRRLLPLPGRVEEARRGDGQSGEGDLRAFQRRRTLRRGEPSRHARKHSVEGRGRGDFPDRLRTQGRDPREQRRLVFHRRLPDPGRLQGREPSLRRLPRQDGRTALRRAALI
jgi:amidophosphoribosyltransferase